MSSFFKLQIVLNGISSISYVLPCIYMWRWICRYRILGVLDFFHLYLCGVSLRIIYLFPLASFELLVWVRVFFFFSSYFLINREEFVYIYFFYSSIHLIFHLIISNNKTTDFFIDCICRHDCVLQYTNYITFYMFINLFEIEKYCYRRNIVI